MIKSETVFVVGAGASIEAGLPSSDTLTKIIAEIVPIGDELNTQMVDGDIEIQKALLCRVGSSAALGPYYDAGHQIKNGMLQAKSIDRFIDSHNDDKVISLCGKLAIVKAILDAEHASLQYASSRKWGDKFHFGGTKITWYDRLWDLLEDEIDNNTVEDIFDNISFVIFNYDRCVEHFLYNSLGNYYNLQPEKAATIMKSLKIFHPYGQVGTLRWQEYYGATEYGNNEIEPSELLIQSGKIKTYTEQLADNEELAAMRQIMGEAEHIVFLGFGFHQQNMKLIKPKEPTNTKRVFATTLGISESDREYVKQDIASTFGLQSHPPYLGIEVGNGKLRCVDLFDEYRIALSR